MAELERLSHGHRTVGDWTLAQICRHLADSVDGSMDGFGVRHHLIMRRFFGRSALQRVFETDRLGSGFTVTVRLNPPGDCDQVDSTERLRRAISRYRAHRGALHFHPFFGALTRSEWDRLHCIHCAHHLRYAVPDRVD